LALAVLVAQMIALEQMVPIPYLAQLLQPAAVEAAYITSQRVKPEVLAAAVAATQDQVKQPEMATHPALHRLKEAMVEPVLQHFGAAVAVALQQLEMLEQMAPQRAVMELHQRFLAVQ
jgi:hypothetical protein